MFSKELFGQRLLEVRKKHKETQEQLADVLGIGKSQISEIETGKHSTSAEKVALICEHYGVSADYLLGISDNPVPQR